MVTMAAPGCMSGHYFYLNVRFIDQESGYNHKNTHRKLKVNFTFDTVKETPKEVRYRWGGTPSLKR